ncbi:MAG: SipW-dependent-type signal peptide-containing protein, partial [Lentihominibacter sp.]
MTNIREKISGRKNVIIAGALIALMVIGSTFAYFVDRDQVTNHFTVGDIEISVSEPNWNPSDGTDITPNKVMKKDPKITNDGANDAFVFMSVKVPKANVKTANADGTLNAAANQDLLYLSTEKGSTGGADIILD